MPESQDRSLEPAGDIVLAATVPQPQPGECAKRHRTRNEKESRSRESVPRGTGLEIRRSPGLE